MNHLVAHRLGKQFGNELVFCELSFEMEGGQLLGVTGANGSGKSTLLRILSGVIQPNRGEVELTTDAGRLSDEERPLHTGFVAPYLQLYGTFSARENLEFQARMRGDGEYEHPIDRVLERVGLSARADDLLSTYSSGMYQRVRLASALLGSPPLLLLDEPFSNLDEDGRRTVDHVIEHERSGGTIQIMATNSARYAERCDRTIRMEDFKTLPQRSSSN